tara:strand:- start:99 stop:521 length:423 start_codon:yes stop_codon:yes gene_type:complete
MANNNYDSGRNRFTAGIGAVGSYQVSGKPWVSGSIDCKPGPVKISFPLVTRWIVIQNHDSDGTDHLKVAFSELGLPSKGGTNYFSVHDSSTYSYWSVPRLELKVTELWIEGADDVDIIAGLTGISCDEIPNNWSGSAGVG